MIQLAIALAMQSVTITPEVGQHWRCTFPAFEGTAHVETTLSVYRTHAEDDLAGRFTIIQDDAAALVLASSQMGDTDIEGRAMRSAAIDMLDKRTREFRRTVLRIDKAPETRTGRCDPA